MSSESKTLVAGTYELVNNNGTVRFRNTNNSRMTTFANNWQADGIRRVLRTRLPAKGETLIVERDIVVNKPRQLVQS